MRASVIEPEIAERTSVLQFDRFHAGQLDCGDQIGNPATVLPDLSADPADQLPMYKFTGAAIVSNLRANRPEQSDFVKTATGCTDESEGPRSYDRFRILVQ